MNTDSRYPVTASLFMLREMKRRHEQVHRGHELLKRKAEALRYRSRQVAADLCETAANIIPSLREAYICLAAAKFANGEYNVNAMILENLGQAQVRVVRVLDNVSGVTTTSLVLEEGDRTSDPLRLAGLAVGGHRLGEAKKAFRDALLQLIKLASLRNTCVLLDDAVRNTMRFHKNNKKHPKRVNWDMPKTRTERMLLMKCHIHVDLGHIHKSERTSCNFVAYPNLIPSPVKFDKWRMPKTRREKATNYKTIYGLLSGKVNGISKVIIPKLLNTEKYIITEMDEREREDIHRLKMVKAKKLRDQSIEALLAHKANSKCGSYVGDYRGTVTIQQVSAFHANERLISLLLYPGNTRSTLTVNSNQIDQPVCFPHFWDDEDILF